jgi:hypothetical protein
MQPRRRETLGSRTRRSQFGLAMATPEGDRGDSKSKRTYSEGRLNGSVKFEPLLLVL